MFKRFFSGNQHDSAHNEAGTMRSRVKTQWNNLYHSTKNKLSRGAQSIFRAVRVARLSDSHQHRKNADHTGHRKF